MKIIAFGHRKRVGKDTATRFLITELRLANSKITVKKKGFADKLKQIIYDLYSWAGVMPGPFYDEESNEHLKEVILHPIGKSPRQLWIEAGNKFREIHPDTWLDFVLKKPDCDLLIISDLRFPNEANKIKDAGGQVIKIIRPSIPNTDDAADIALADYLGWDHLIDNSGSLNDFHGKIAELARGVING